MRSQLPPVLVVTNPVEPIVTWLWEQTGIAPSELFGLGTTVDAARLSMHIGNRVGVSARSAWTTLVGEHGEGLIIAGHGSLSGVVADRFLKPLEERSLFHTRMDAKVIRNLTEAVARGQAERLLENLERILGNTVSEPQRAQALDCLAADLAPPATRFAIAAAVTEVARAMHSDEQRVMTVSSSPPAEWKLPAVALALPFQIGGRLLGRCLLADAPEGLSDIASRIEKVVQSLPPLR